MNRRRRLVAHAQISGFNETYADIALAAAALAFPQLAPS